MFGQTCAKPMLAGREGWTSRRLMACEMPGAGARWHARARGDGAGCGGRDRGYLETLRRTHSMGPYLWSRFQIVLRATINAKKIAPMRMPLVTVPAVCQPRRQIQRAPSAMWKRYHVRAICPVAARARVTLVSWK